VIAQLLLQDASVASQKSAIGIESLEKARNSLSSSVFSTSWDEIKRAFPIVYAFLQSDDFPLREAPPGVSDQKRGR
jgi:hypothetical protein